MRFYCSSMLKNIALDLVIYISILVMYNTVLCLLNSSETLEFRDWSLFTGRGGGYKTGRGVVKFYPYEKGGRKKF